MVYNWNIIGHEGSLKLLENDIISGNLAHAYLFAGQNQLGKFTIARQMAGILQCNDNFCHQCPICLQIKKGAHIDTIIAKNDGEAVKVGFIRDLISRVSMTTQSKYTLVLIEQIERMTPAAANALLKTLEEPPENVIFILTTENVRLILPTILSRVRIINFEICADDALKIRLKELFPDVDDQTLEQVSLLSLGKPGKAIEFLEDRTNLDYYQALYNEACALLNEKTIYRKFQYVETLLSKDFMVQDFLDIFEHVLRSRLLHLQLGKDIDEDLSSFQLLSLIKETQFARFNISKNINARLLLENLLLAI